MLYIDLTAPRTLAAANAHYYVQPTEERYLDRVLEYHDLIYLDEGGWSMTEGKDEYPLQKGDVLFLASGRHHYNKYPCLPETRTFCLHVTVAPGDCESAKTSTILPTHFHVLHPEKVRQYFSDLVNAWWSDDVMKEKRIESLLFLLLLELRDEYHFEQESRKNVAERAMQMIDSNPHKRFETNEMADLLFISPKTLNNAMHKKVGMPFYRYEKERKLEMAAMRLSMEPESKLSEIAASYGFHDEFHFSKAFKQKYGISPAEYRSKKGL